MRALSRTTTVMLVMVCAQMSPVAQGRGARTASAGLATTVFGFVWNANNEPIAFAHVRLRNVTTGRAEAMAVATDSGEFTFEHLEGGTYVIEYVDGNGKVLAVGHVFSVSRGETVATFIRLGSRSSWFAALLGSAGNVAATAVSSAASLGVTALAPASRPVSAEF
jgi:hypothetical protein